MPLMEPDEGRYALIPREMNERGDYVTPHLKGVTYLEKPPLVYWWEAFFFRLLGENELSARLASGLSAWGCVILVYLIGCAWKNRELGLLSAAVFSVSLLPFALARINILDMPLTLFLSLAVWSGYRHFTKPKKNFWLYGVYFFGACAFLTKGLVGLFFPFFIILLWLWWMKRWREIPNLISPMGIIILVILIGPWLWAVQRANPEFLEFFFLREHILRYTTTVHERGEPFYFFLPIVFAGALPWWFYLPRQLKSFKINTLWEQEKEAHLVKLIILWILFPLVFFSLSSSKMVQYILPVFIPLSVFLAWLLLPKPHFHDGRNRLDIWPVIQSLMFAALVVAPLFIPAWKHVPSLPWPFYAIPMLIQILIMLYHTMLDKSYTNTRYLITYFAYACFLLSVLPLISHYLSPGKSAHQLAQALERHVPPQEVVYQFRTIQYGLDFYTKRRTPVVDEQGELAPGVKKLTPADRRRYFPVTAGFLEEIERAKSVYVITDRREKLAWLQGRGIGIRVLWENGKFYLFQAYDKGN